MTTAFVDYAADQVAREQIANAVMKHTEMLCEALVQNYIKYCIRSHQRSLESTGDLRIDLGSVEYDYHQRKINQLKSGECDIAYEIETGRKYHKIIFIDGGGQRSVHAFVDKKTGEIYKPSTWKSPSKGVRFDLRIISQREWLFEHADWSGGYLYAR